MLFAGEDTAFAPLLPELIGDVQQRGLSSEVQVQSGHILLWQGRRLADLPGV